MIPEAHKQDFAKMTRPCQNCGSPVKYFRRVPSKARGSVSKGFGSRDDHDLCGRCWKAQLDSRREIIKAERVEVEAVLIASYNASRQ